jgi:hypothetical protein
VFVCFSFAGIPLKDMDFDRSVKLMKGERDLLITALTR